MSATPKTSSESIFPVSRLLLRLLMAVVFLVVGLLPALSTQSIIAKAYAETKQVQGRISFFDASYRLGPGDVLSYHVYNQEDFEQGNILVRPDGFASFNGVGEIYVNGKAIEEVRAILAERIGELVLNPIVTVTVSQTKPGTIYLSGAVRKPGMFQLSTGNQNSVTGPTTQSAINRIDLRLSNILANAGGVMPNADIAHVAIRRVTPVGETTIEVDLWLMLKHGDASQDVMLQSGDAVMVPKLANGQMSEDDFELIANSSIGPDTFPIRVLGEVMKPGVYNIPGQTPYLNSALAMAEGFNPQAYRKTIVIRRFTSDKQYETFTVNPEAKDVSLRPNDIVYIAPMQVAKAGRYMENVGKVLAPFTTAAFTGAMFGM